MVGRRVLPLIIVAAVFVLIVTFALIPTSYTPNAEWLPNIPQIPRPSNPNPSKTSTGFVAPPKDPNDPDRVDLDYLSIRPRKNEHVRYYWNMPYAAPAYGKNRFRGPQPPPLYNTNGTLEWSGKLGMCPRIQKIDATLRNRKDIASEDVSGLYAEYTEDCLSLNVFTPIDAEAGDELPVIVNIPGGGFHLPGRANCGEFVQKSRGKNDKGVVCVTMYYRNGIYGFLSGDEIQKDGDFNMGLRDQRASLEWIQKYIRYFGGNPDHVVIMGTSAGAASVLLHLTANGGDNTFAVPGSGRRQLFHGAITQSPAAPTFFNKEQANQFWKNVATGLNCTDLSVDCVRAASVGDLYYQNYPMSFPGRNTPPRWMWAPTIEPEGGMWTEPGMTSFLEGRYAKVPTIIGFTSNEGSDQVKKTTDTIGEFKSYLKDHYPLLTDHDLDLLAKNYPNDKHWPDSGRYWDAVAKAQGDIRYICPAYLSSNSIAAHNPPSVKAWQYQWDVTWGPDNENGFGTKHAATVGRVLSRPMNEVSEYFISFIKHLDPNPDKNPANPTWEPVNTKNPKRFLFTNREAGKDRSIKMRMEGQDPGREKRCSDIRQMMPRTQQ